MHTRPDIDLVLLNEFSLQIRFLSENEENLIIEGADAMHFYDFLERGRLDKVVPNTDNNGYYDLAKRHRIVTDSQSVKTEKLYLPRCFIPVHVKDDLHCIRVDRRLYVFRGQNPEEIVEKSLLVARSCIDREDRSVFLKVFNDPANLKISAASMYVDVQEFFKDDNLSCVDKLNEYLVLRSDGQSLSLSRFRLSAFLDEVGISNPYWQEIIDYALRNQIVTRLDLREGYLPHTGNSYIRYICASSARNQTLSDSSTKLQFTYAGGETELEAVGKSCAEAMERFFSQRPVTGVLTSESELAEKGEKILPLRDFVHLLPQQRDFLKIPDIDYRQETLEWAQVQDMEGSTSFVPAFLCHYGEYKSALETLHFFASTSNGCAAHTTAPDAVLTGARECVERDAVMIWWYNRLSPPSFAEESLPENIRRFLKEPDARNYEIAVLDLTLDTLPVAMIVARNRENKWPYFLCGAGCGLSYSAALKSAFSEFYAAFTSKHLQEKVLMKPIDVQFTLDHGVYYLDPSHGNVLDFLFNGPQTGGGWKETYHDDLWASLQEKIGPVYVCALQECAITPERKLCVTKTIVPGLVPIAFGYMRDPLNHRRIYDLPVKLGLRDKSVTPEEILENYQPHFFP